MKLKTLLIAVSCILITEPIAAIEDIMITRDGSMITVKVEKISSSQVTFIDLRHKKRGRLNAPADFVYMIMKEKGNNLFFDEEGNQTTSPIVKFDKKDNVMFLNHGEMLVIYNFSIGKDEVVYQLKNKSDAPKYKISKDEVFMIRNSDGTTTLYNDSYQQRLKENQAMSAQAKTTLETSTIPAQQSTVTTPHPVATSVTITPTATQQQLLASGTAEKDFFPAPEMNATEIEMKVNSINPYTLYRKGSVAEYCFQYKGKQTQWMGGPTYLQQIVSEEKIENGLLVAYIRQDLYNKKHEPLKGVSASYKECLFPVEIDTAGTYHLTHNVAQDFLIITKRRGYGILIPGTFQQGMQLKSSTLYDNAKNLIGGIVKTETEYSDWRVSGEDKITTPAGTFECVKLTGHLAQKQGRSGKFYGKKITCWIARGIGIVQYETIADTSKDKEPFVIYLNKIDIK